MKNSEPSLNGPEGVKRLKTGGDREGEAPAEPHGARTCDGSPGGSPSNLSMVSGPPTLLSTTTLQAFPNWNCPRFFAPFYRLADARDRRSGGVGLGLAIADRVAQLHDGKILASNAANGGLQVEVSIPIAQ